MINVGCDAATTEQAIAVAAAHDGIFATAGLHPHEAKHGVDTIVAFLDDPNVVAVGECGLDYYYDHSPRRRAARRVRRADPAGPRARAAAGHPHPRRVGRDVRHPRRRGRAGSAPIFHCFTGGPDEARQCLDRGAYLSFSGIVTFKTATELHEAARLCPLERMLAETDSPYLAPVPHRGSPNQPAYVTHVVHALAELRGADRRRGARRYRGERMPCVPGHSSVAFSTSHGRETTQ